MDDPHSDRLRLIATHDQFRLTNRLFSRYRTLLTRHVLRDMERLRRRSRPVRSFTVLEIGAGACDVAIWLARAFRKRGIAARITCIDNDSRIASHARRLIMASGLSDRITFLQLSAFDANQLPDYDYVICGNTLHHFTEDQARILLGLMARKAARRFLASDLERSPIGWMAFWAFSTMFLHGSFVRHDGLVSFARAFVPRELRALAQEAGNRHQARVLHLFPARLCVLGAGAAGKVPRARPTAAAFPRMNPSAADSSSCSSSPGSFRRSPAIRPPWAATAPRPGLNGKSQLHSSLLT